MLPESGVDVVRARSGELFFDSAAVENLIADYQANGELATLSEIMSHCQSIPLSLIRRRRTAHYADEGELMSTINRKLLISLPQFDRVKGSAFSFVSRLAVNMLATTVTHRKKLARRYPALDEVFAATVPDPADPESAIAVDAWDLAVATLILIESMNLRLSEMKPDYYEPKESDKETDGLKGQPEQPKWGAIYRVPLPNDPWQAVPNNRPPPDKRSPWGAINWPVQL